MVYISCNKGNNKGNKNLVKYRCWYCKKDIQAKMYLLDVDCACENAENSVNIVRHILEIIFETNIGNLPIKICGQCTDSGSSGTGNIVL